MTVRHTANSLLSLVPNKYAHARPRLLLDLSHAFARDILFVCNFFECVRTADEVSESKTHRHDAVLAFWHLTASVEAGDVTNRPDLGDYCGCCGCVCCCHVPDCEDPSRQRIRPCDTRNPYLAGVFPSVGRNHVSANLAPFGLVTSLMHAVTVNPSPTTTGVFPAQLPDIIENNNYKYMKHMVKGNCTMGREEKREKFVRLAETRVSKAMQAIRVVGNLSNRSNYEFSDEDIKKISRALNAEIEAMQARFKNADSKARPEFKL